MRVIVSAFVFMVLAAGSAVAQSADDDAETTLTVQGSGEIRVVPDLATVRVGITEQASTAEAAQRDVNTAANDILEAVRALGIEDRHIQTARLTLMPVYSRGRPAAADPPQITAYRASNTVSIRMENLKRVGMVIDAALGAGANQLEGVCFGLKNDLEARADALRSAITEARRKAQAMADALRSRTRGGPLRQRRRRDDSAAGDGEGTGVGSAARRVDSGFSRGNFRNGLGIDPVPHPWESLSADRAA